MNLVEIIQSMYVLLAYIKSILHYTGISFPLYYQICVDCNISGVKPKTKHVELYT